MIANHFLALEQKNGVGGVEPRGKRDSFVTECATINEGMKLEVSMELLPIANVEATAFRSLRGFLAEQGKNHSFSLHGARTRSIRNQASDRHSDSDSASGANAHFGSSCLSRREALAATAAAATANPARALIQTGSDRDEGKLGQSAIDRLQSRVSTFKLSNGMKWVVLERHNAPIISCHTYADVGASDEAPGMTGIAHLLEHLAFKGTKLIGTKDAKKEAAILDKLDDMFYALRDAKARNNNNDTDLVRRLTERFKEAQVEASEVSIANQYGSLIERQGGVGLNAQTSQDETEYMVSLPANKLELWMALESGRFIAPVFRELYSEKEVVKEERRLRVENSPYGRFTEAFTEAAFPGGAAYGRPVIGYPEDFETIGRKEVTEFFRRNYTPCNLTCALVGDVDPAEVEKLASRYFGSWGVPCSSPHASEFSQLWRSRDGWDSAALATSSAARSFVRMDSPAQPLYMEGYYRPPAWSCDDPVISVISELLSGGRVSRFYKRLIAPGRALSAECVDSFPGDKYPCLMLLYGSPRADSSTGSLADDLRAQLEDLVLRGVDDRELVPIKKSARASLLEALGSNSAMARILSSYEARAGSWIRILEETKEVESVSAADVIRVAPKLFSPHNCIAGST